jgi:hypothetical protein
MNRNGSRTLGIRSFIIAAASGAPAKSKRIQVDPISGPNGIWNMANLHFPGAVQIVDLYHARQHLWELARKLHANDEAGQRALIKIHQKRLLDKRKIEKLVCAIRSTHPTNPELSEKIRIETEYFETNTEHMRYPKFRRQHLLSVPG